MSDGGSSRSREQQIDAESEEPPSITGSSFRFDSPRYPRFF
jgi:hypothetical protein